MEENKNDYRGDRNDNRNNYGNRNRNNNNRFRHGGGGGGHGGHPGGRGRVQRPLLTSAINGAGLTLVALVLLKGNADNQALVPCVALSTCSFGVSALISYAAQRLRPKIIEIISDLFFLSGILGILHVGLKLGGFF